LSETPLGFFAGDVGAIGWVVLGFTGCVCFAATDWTALMQ
jgi:hypothetical protein